jgi:hypothetical protein
MKDERKLLYAYGISITICLFILVAARTWEKSPSGTFFEASEEMDRLEEQYDGEYIVMVSTKDALVGTYYRHTPIKHYMCRVVTMSDEPTAYTVEQLESIGIEMGVDNYWDIYNSVPKGTPMLVY